MLGNKLSMTLAFGLGALVACNDGGSGSGNAMLDRGACDVLIDCAASLAPDVHDEYEQTYGPNGTCWQNGPNNWPACRDTCATTLQALNSAAMASGQSCGVCSTDADCSDYGDGFVCADGFCSGTSAEETGVWALQQYALDGGPHVDIAKNRKNRFLLRFKPKDGVVAAAACHEENTAVDVNGSNCTNAALSSWSCWCFAYTHDGNTMLWQEFEPGDLPPPVGAGAHEVFISEVPDTSFYEFSPLPVGLFNSDGEVSRYIFEKKADVLWTMTDINQDGVNDLDSCSNICFPSGI